MANFPLFSQYKWFYCKNKKKDGFEKQMLIESTTGKNFCFGFHLNSEAQQIFHDLCTTVTFGGSSRACLSWWYSWNISSVVIKIAKHGLSSLQETVRPQSSLGTTMSFLYIRSLPYTILVFSQAMLLWICLRYWPEGWNGCTLNLVGISRIDLLLLNIHWHFSFLPLHDKMWFRIEKLNSFVSS